MDHSKHVFRPEQTSRYYTKMGNPPSKTTVIAQTGVAASARARDEESWTSDGKMSLAAVTLVSAAVSLGTLYLVWRYCKIRIKAAVDHRINKMVTHRTTNAVAAYAHAQPQLPSLPIPIPRQPSAPAPVQHVNHNVIV